MFHEEDDDLTDRGHEEDIQEERVFIGDTLTRGVLKEDGIERDVSDLSKIKEDVSNCLEVLLVFEEDGLVSVKTP